MKQTYSSLLLLLALGLGAARAEEGKPAAPAQTTPPAGAPATPAPAPSFTDAQLVEEFGWIIGRRTNLAELELSSAELDALIKGLRTAAAGQDSPYDPEQIGQAMNDFMMKKNAAYITRLKSQNDKANLDFFAKLKENKNVVETPSGLRYEILQEGQGAKPSANDTVKVHYTGTLIDGSVFDSSVQRGEPAEFGLDQVIPGWTEGIQKVSKGGKIKLYVPPHLAYGDDGRPGIPPSSTLIFEVELLDITPAASNAPAAAPTPAAK